MADIFDELTQQATSPKQRGDVFEQIQSDKQTPIQTAGGIAGGLAGAYGAYRIGKPIVRAIDTTIGGIANLPKVANTEKGAKFAEDLQNLFVKSHTNKVNEFGDEITKLAKANPTKNIDLSDFVSDIVTDPDLSPQAISAYRKTPILNRFLKDPELANGVSLKDTQEIINHLNTKVPKNIRANNLDLLDGINIIKARQLDAFPEMGIIRANYKEFIEPYTKIKNYFRFNKTLSGIANEFGGAQGWEAAKKIFPKEIIKKMKNFRTASQISRLPKAIPLLGRALAVGLPEPFIQDIMSQREFGVPAMRAMELIMGGKPTQKEFEDWQRRNML